MGRETTIGRRAARLRLGPIARRPRVRLGAVVALAVAAGLLTWLLLRGNGGPTQATRAPAQAVSARQLAALPSTVHHAVYWAGAQPGFTYELSRTHAGLIYVRYLPAGAAVGAKRPYLTIGTYPVKHALAAVRAIATRLGTAAVPLRGGGVAVQDTAHPTSVYFAYPGSDYEVEVFDPSPARARQLALSGRVVPIGSPSGPTTSTRAPASAATIGDLRRLAASVGHPVYWAGPQSGVTYEQTRTSDGRIYVRYLPPGVKAGAREPYLTVGTYPLQNAVAAVRAISRQAGAQTFAAPGGGVAVVDPAHPTSVYLAFAGSSYEVEVFDPSAARARQLVAAGQIVAVR